MIPILSKVFAIVLAVLALSRSITDYRSKKESLIMAVFWVVVWLGISALALYPAIIDRIISLSGGNRTGIGTIYGLSIVFVMFVNYRIYLKAHRIENQLRKIATHIGLKNLE